MRIFEPFFTTKENGLGLGLAICRKIARAHDGTLLADSREGEGAIFRLVLPCADAGGGAGSAPVRPGRPRLNASIVCRRPPGLFVEDRVNAAIASTVERGLATLWSH